jgi:hypothetical protein
MQTTFKREQFHRTRNPAAPANLSAEVSTKGEASKRRRGHPVKILRLYKPLPRKHLKAVWPENEVFLKILSKIS